MNSPDPIDPNQFARLDTELVLRPEIAELKLQTFELPGLQAACHSEMGYHTPEVNSDAIVVTDTMTLVFDGISGNSPDRANYTGWKAANFMASDLPQRISQALGNPLSIQEFPHDPLSPENYERLHLGRIANPKQIDYSEAPDPKRYTCQSSTFTTSEGVTKAKFKLQSLQKAPQLWTLSPAQISGSTPLMLLPEFQITHAINQAVQSFFQTLKEEKIHKIPGIGSAGTTLTGIIDLAEFGLGPDLLLINIGDSSASVVFRSEDGKKHVIISEEHSIPGYGPSSSIGAGSYYDYKNKKFYLGPVCPTEINFARVSKKLAKELVVVLTTDGIPGHETDNRTKFFESIGPEKTPERIVRESIQYARDCDAASPHLGDDKTIYVAKFS